MIVLGFDTATRSTTVGLRLSEGDTIEARDDPAPGAHPGHATRLLAMTDELLARAGVAWSALDRVAVGVGPGTFTGLRVGIATARGLAQSLAVDLVGVSSLLALAHAAAAEQGQGQGQGGLVSVIDARRGQAFAAAYGLSGDGAVDELAAPRALAPEDFGSVVTEAERRAGGPGEPWLAVGDGAIRFREHLELAGVVVPADSSRLHLLDARATCALGALAEPVAGLEQLLPDYRRRADAEIALGGVAAGRADG